MIMRFMVSPRNYLIDIHKLFKKGLMANRKNTPIFATASSQKNLNKKEQGIPRSLLQSVVL